MVVDSKGQIVDTIGELPPPPPLPDAVAKAVAEPGATTSGTADKAGKESAVDDKRPPPKENLLEYLETFGEENYFAKQPVAMTQPFL